MELERKDEVIILDEEKIKAACGQFVSSQNSAIRIDDVSVRISPDFKVIVKIHYNIEKL